MVDQRTGDGALIMAAICYAAQAGGELVYVQQDAANLIRFVDPFPWFEGDARAYDGNVICAEPRDEAHRLRLLEKAGALIAAEIDRLVRAGGRERT